MSAREQLRAFGQQFAYKLKPNLEINHKKLWMDTLTGMASGFIATLVAGAIIGIIGAAFEANKQNIFDDVRRALNFVTPFGVGIGIGMRTKQPPMRLIGIGIVCFLAARSSLVPYFDRPATGVSADQAAIIFSNPARIFPGINVPWVGGANYFNINFAAANGTVQQIEALTESRFLVGIRETGDILTTIFAGAMALYAFSIFDKFKTNVDFLVIPVIAIIMGMIAGLTFAYPVVLVSVVLEYIIYVASQTSAGTIAVAPVIGGILGMAIVLPISSAALTLATALSEDAALAGITGTSSMMVAWTVLTWWTTRRFGTTAAVMVCSAKMYVTNYSRRPILFLIPILVCMASSVIAVAVFENRFPYSLQINPVTGIRDVLVPEVTAGMGTVALYGQIFTLTTFGWDNMWPWLNVLFMQLLIPLALAAPAVFLLGKFCPKILKKEWLQLNTG